MEDDLHASSTQSTSTMNSYSEASFFQGNMEHQFLTPLGRDPEYHDLVMCQRFFDEERERLKIACFQHIMNKIITKPSPESKSTCGLMRTIRFIKRDATKLVLNKSLVSINKPSVESFSNIFSTAKVAKIFHELQADDWPEEVVLLITPTKKHKEQFKLHLIDRIWHGHLGMCTITKEEFHRLKFAKTFQKNCMIIGSKFIRLKDIISQTGILANLINTINAISNHYSHKCKHNCQTKKSSSPTNSDDDEMHDPQTPCSCFCENCRSSQNITNRTPDLAQQLRDEYEDDNLKYVNNPNNPLLSQLFDKINKATELTDSVLGAFFRIAERYKFRLYVRPNLLAAPCLGSPENLFKVECFLLNECYLGCLTLNSEQLQRGLCYRDALLTRVEAIHDVLSITPAPRLLKKILRKWRFYFSADLWYDCIAEYLFNVYKQHM